MMSVSTNGPGLSHELFKNHLFNEALQLPRQLLLTVGAHFLFLYFASVQTPPSLSNSFTLPSCGCPLENGQLRERQGPFVSRVSHSSTGMRTWCEQVTLNL